MATAQKQDSAAIARELEARKERLTELQERETTLRSDIEEAREALGVATARGADCRNEKERVRSLAEDLEANVRAVSIVKREIEELDGARKDAETAEAGAVAAQRTEEARQALRTAAGEAEAFRRRFMPLVLELDDALQKERKAEVLAARLRDGGTAAPIVSSRTKTATHRTHRALYAFMDAVRQFEKNSGGSSVDSAA